jgi:stage V sporulation protein D (sporulation-specific penicillin-binding protein)
MQLGRTDSRARLFLVLAVILVAATGMGARLAYWQIGQRQTLANLEVRSAVRTETIPAHRGTIYDRTGTIVLAQTIDRYRVVGDPHDLTDVQKARTTTVLIDYLDLSDEDAAKIRSAMSGDAYYIVLATDVDAEVAQQMMAYQAEGGLAGITFEPQPVRVYPQAGGAPHTSLAAQLLGFVNASGIGQYGIEQRYDALLAGRPEKVEIDPDMAGPDGTRIVDPGQPGQDIRTTIDATLQLQVEQEVFAAWIADKAKTVSAVVMNPTTGELLAEASYPTYDANQYSAVADTNPGLFNDPVVSLAYEPGSVFKMLTASAALETRTTLLTTKINDTGVMALPGGQEIADADRKKKGLMTFADIIAWSRNVGAAQAALRLGKTTTAASKVLYQTWITYGIGRKTGIDVAGEVSGTARDPSVDYWAQMDLANASFGQGVAATPIQVTRAFAAMVNGGVLLTPRVVQPDDRIGQPVAEVSSGTQIIPSTLSSSLTGLMEHVVTAVPSYAQRTYIKGYYVGGKTGTAQIWDPKAENGAGGWKPNDYNYSFYGWIGRDKPALVVGVVIFEGTPTTIKQGVLDMPVQSYELFRRIATDAVIVQHIPPNPDGPAPPGGKKATPQG